MKFFKIGEGILQSDKDRVKLQLIIKENKKMLNARINKESTFKNLLKKRQQDLEVEEFARLVILTKSDKTDHVVNPSAHMEMRE